LASVTAILIRKIKKNKIKLYVIFIRTFLAAVPTVVLHRMLLSVYYNEFKGEAIPRQNPERVPGCSLLA